VSETKQYQDKLSSLYSFVDLELCPADLKLCLVDFKLGLAELKLRVVDLELCRLGASP